MEVNLFYETQLKRSEEERDRLSKRIHTCGTVRLILFIAAIAALWYFRNAGWLAPTAAVTLPAIPFIALIVIHNKLSGQKLRLEEQIRLNRAELRGLAGDFSAFDGAAGLMTAGHAFSLDLDIFGEKSLFQSINRTVTAMGRQRLADWFLHPLTDTDAIRRRQCAVRELALKTPFRQQFCITGARQGTYGDIQRLEALAAGHKTRFRKSRIWCALIWIIPVLWLVMLTGSIYGFLSPATAGWFFAVSFTVANLPARHIHTLYKSVDRMEKLLLAYSRLMEQTEAESFDAALLVDLQGRLAGQGGSASRAVKRLSSIINALDQRFSLAGILLNMFYLRDIRHVMQLELWLERNACAFGKWFDALSEIDALNSSGGFAFNHPDYVWPVLVDTCFRMEGKALGHPLLSRTQCVRNDITLTGAPCFLVITGANMAGKSTFLRTAGVNFLLSCMGLPVCAESLTVSPANIMTSLRTADSLAASESCFFAELKRLKTVIDRLDAGEKLFILLDEVLKGTNSTDRQKGAMALVRQLIAKKTCGLIATHDLLLGTLAEHFPNEVENWCFESDIEGDMLAFTYRIRKGIAHNMNACFLMKEMGIIL
jgi:hypothetical protein